MRLPEEAYRALEGLQAQSRSAGASWREGKPVVDRVALGSAQQQMASCGEWPARIYRLLKATRKSIREVDRTWLEAVAIDFYVEDLIQQVLCRTCRGTSDYSEENPCADPCRECHGLGFRIEEALAFEEESRFVVLKALLPNRVTFGEETCPRR